MTVARRLVFPILLLAALAARPASAIVFQSTAAQTAGLGAGQSFLNGEAELTINLSNGVTAGCSGSLVDGGQYVLTAAHCVTGDTGTASANSISIDFANVGLTVSASTYIVDPTWTGSVSDGGDLALIKLAAAVTSIASYQLDTAASAVGDTVTLAGYGETGTGTTGAQSGTFGTLYDGTNVYTGVYSNIPSVYVLNFQQFGRDAAMIGPGDSGGASLVDIGGVWEIVGVHDFDACQTTGCTPNATFGQLGGDTSVYADAAFLDSILVPEPASLLLVGSGLSGVLAVRRRKRACPDDPGHRR